MLSCSRSRLWCDLADDPYLLRRPATGPPAVEVHEARVCVLRRPQLDEVVDDEAVVPEAADPFAVRELEVDGALPTTVVEASNAEVGAPEAPADALALEVPGEVRPRRRVREHQPTAGAQQTCRLGDGPVGVAERHRAVVAEDDIERTVGERCGLGAGAHERYDAGSRGHER